MLPISFHLFEVDVGTSGTDSAGSSGMTREASFFSLWLLYAATPAIAAVRRGFQISQNINEINSSHISEHTGNVGVK